MGQDRRTFSFDLLVELVPEAFQLLEWFCIFSGGTSLILFYCARVCIGVCKKSI